MDKLSETMSQNKLSKLSGILVTDTKVSNTVVEHLPITCKGPGFDLESQRESWETGFFYSSDIVLHTFCGSGLSLQHIKGSSRADLSDSFQDAQC